VPMSRLAISASSVQSAVKLWRLGFRSPTPILFTTDHADATDANPTADRIFNTEFTEGTEEET